MENLDKQQQRWEDETGKHSQAIIDFLASGVITSSGYDSLVELHFSGTNRDVFDGISKGTEKPLSVNCYYENNIVKQIHVVFAGVNTQNIDVYLQGRALDDYLSQAQ